MWKSFTTVHILKGSHRYSNDDGGRKLASIVSVSFANIEFLNSLTLENRVREQGPRGWVGAAIVARRNQLLHRIATPAFVASGIAVGKQVFVTWKNTDAKTVDTTAWTAAQRKRVEECNFKLFGSHSTMAY